MAAKYRKRGKQKRHDPQQEAKLWMLKEYDPPGFLVKEFQGKGRGVVTTCYRNKGDFLLHYAGEVIPAEEGEWREHKQSTGYRFFYNFGKKKLCVDASLETGRLGRLVNHGKKKEKNAVMKEIDGSLFLFCLRDIEVGEEICYDYGLKDLPWEKMTKQAAEKGFEVGDLLWCKLEVYPWWPSLVCNHPTQNTHFKGGKNPQVHVQFFDNPVSRAWIKQKNCHEYKGSDDAQVQKGGMFYTNSVPVVKGAEAADDAMKLSREDRLGLVVELQHSDEEDEMDLDPEIFDDEMSGDDNSKDNMDVEKEKVKKTPSKSPAKGRRSKRNRAKRRRIIVEAGNDSEEHDSGTVAQVLIATETETHVLTAAETEAQLLTATETEAKVLTATETETQVISAAETEAQLLTATETEAQVLTATETVAQVLTATETEAKLLTATETVAQVLTATETEAQVLTATETEAQVLTATETVAQVLTATDTEAQVVTTTETEAQVLTATDTEAQVVTTTETEAQVVTATETEAQVLTATETEAQVLTATDTEAQVVTTTETEAQVLTATETEAQVLTSTETEVQMLTSTETERQMLTATETEVQMLTAIETEVQVLTATEIEAQVLTATETEVQVLTATETEVQALTATETEAQVLTAIETGAQVLIATETECQALAAAETESQVLTATETEAQVLTATETEAQVVIPTKTKAQVLKEYSETEAQVLTTTEIEAEVLTAAETEVQVLTNQETEAVELITSETVTYELTITETDAQVLTTTETETQVLTVMETESQGLTVVMTAAEMLAEMQTISPAETVTEAQSMMMYDVKGDDKLGNLSSVSSKLGALNEAVSDSECSDIVAIQHPIPLDKVLVVAADSSSDRTQKRPTTDNTDTNTEISIQFAEAGITRDYKKRHSCYFCDKSPLKMARHLENCHNDNPEIATMPTKEEASNSSGKKVQRNYVLDKYRNLGNFNHNVNVLVERKGVLYVGRRPSTIGEKNPLPKDYLPCQFCYVFYISKELWRHSRNCKYHKSHIRYESTEQEKNARKSMFSAGKLLLQGATGEGAVGFQIDHEEFQEHVLESLRSDEVSRAIKSDPLILLFGKTQFNKLGSARAAQVREKLRILGRLKLRLRTSTGRTSACIEDFISTDQYDICVSSVKALAVESNDKTLSGTKSFNKPSLALKAGQLLKKIAELKKGRAVRTRDTETKSDVTDFIDLYEREFTDEVSSIARQTLSERKYNTKDVLPVTADLVKLTKHMEARITDLTVKLKRSQEYCVWRDLAETTLARLICFNKRRSNEPSMMLVDKFKCRPDWKTRMWIL